ncbi:DUF1015 domain-containing protein [Caldicellulosiruptoraceae bacterium PP1]
MAEIKAFFGVRYAENIDLDKVICPPYDIISESEREELYQKSPYNIIRIEYGKELPNDNEKENKFTRAKKSLDEWLNSGILKKEDKESLYILEQEFEVDGVIYKRTGIIALIKLTPFSEGVVIPHEFTLSKPKEERLNLLKATKTNISSIYGLYEDNKKEIENILENIKKNKECFSYNGLGTKEKIWIEQDENVINKLQSLFYDKKIFIADGHHRYETALEYKKQMEEIYGKNPKADYNYVLITLTAIEDPGIVILPTHRVITDSNISTQNLIEKLKENFEVIEGRFEDVNENLNKNKKYSFVVYTSDKKYYFIKLKDQKVLDKINGSKPFKNLDVVILQELILNDILGIDAENLAKQKSLKYTKDINEAVKMVDEGAFCAFILNPTLVEELKDVSLNGEKMPQKSTYFYPKLMTGNVIYVQR